MFSVDGRLRWKWGRKQNVNVVWKQFRCISMIHLADQWVEFNVRIPCEEYSIAGVLAVLCLKKQIPSVSLRKVPFLCSNSSFWSQCFQKRAACRNIYFLRALKAILFHLFTHFEALQQPLLKCLLFGRYLDTSVQSVIIDFFSPKQLKSFFFFFLNLHPSTPTHHGINMRKHQIGLWRLLRWNSIKLQFAGDPLTTLEPPLGAGRRWEPLALMALPCAAIGFPNMLLA